MYVCRVDTFCFVFALKYISSFDSIQWMDGTNKEERKHNGINTIIIILIVPFGWNRLVCWWETRHRHCRWAATAAAATTTTMAFYFHSFIMMIHAISADILWAISTVVVSFMLFLAMADKWEHLNGRWILQSVTLARFTLFVHHWFVFLLFFFYCDDGPTKPFVILSSFSVVFDIVHKLLFPLCCFPSNKIQRSSFSKKQWKESQPKE